MTTSPSRLRRFPALIVLGFTLVAGQAAQAGTQILHTSAPTNQIFDSTGGAQLVDLGQGHGQTFPIQALVPSRLMIMLNAECSMASTTADGWVSVEILVDGVAAAPTSTYQAFCSADGEESLDEWVMGASDVLVDVPAGNHTIQLRGQINNGSGRFWIGDVSLIVIKKDL
jgi:hypothetical protein